MVAPRMVSSSSFSRCSLLKEGQFVRLDSPLVFLRAHRLLKTQAQIICLLDKALVSLDFIDQHLHQLLVPGELGVNFLYVGL